MHLPMPLMGPFSMVFPTSPRQTCQGLETIACCHGPTGVGLGFMTMHENLASLSGEEPTGLETYCVTEDRSELLQDPTPKITREQMSGHRYLTGTVWTYVMATKRRPLLELLLTTDTMDRMRGIRDSYLAMIDWTDPPTTGYSTNSNIIVETRRSLHKT